LLQKLLMRLFLLTWSFHAREKQDFQGNHYYIKLQLFYRGKQYMDFKRTPLCFVYLLVKLDLKRLVYIFKNLNAGNKKKHSPFHWNKNLLQERREFKMGLNIKTTKIYILYFLHEIKRVFCLKNLFQVCLYLVLTDKLKTET